MPHFPPPPTLPPKVKLFQRVPPAIFPALLGVLGLGLAWRRAVEIFGLNGAMVEAYLGMVSLLFAFCVVAYGVKAAKRLGAVGEDFATLPGRTGLAALTMCAMIEAAILAPYSAGLALGVFVAGAIGWFIQVWAAIIFRVVGNDTTGPLTPAAYLVFVGIIVAPPAVMALGGLLHVVQAIVWFALIGTVVLAALTLPALVRGAVPEALRPLQCIHLAPASLVASGAFLSGLPIIASVALAWSCVVAIVLILRARWMTVTGFSGFWSAFTFPISSFAGALILSGQVLAVPAAEVLGGVVLVCATLITLAVGYRVLKLWAKGALAAKTNASIA